jgi:hypothetical protein
MPEVSYSYRVRVAGIEWTGTVGDAAEYGPVDGLQIIRKVADSDLWPTRVEPAECRFQLIVASMADVAAIDLGSVVLVEVRRPAAGPITESFAGRVNELTATPHDLGMLLTLSCLDYKADLRELIVGDAPWPIESISTRVQRVFTLCGWPSVPRDAYLGHNNGSSYTLIGRDVDAQPALDLIEHYLDQWALDYFVFTGGSTDPDYRGLARGQAVQITDANGVLTGWHISPTFQIPYYTGPLRLELVAGKWSAVAAPAAGAAVAMADEVDVSSSYAVTKTDNPNTITLSGPGGGAGPWVLTVWNGDLPQVTATLPDSEIASVNDADVVALMYLPGELAQSRWLADDFLWHLELAAAGATMPQLFDLMTVGGIPTDDNPNQREWYTGQVAMATFTLENKRPSYSFQLRRSSFDAPKSGLVTFGSPAVTTQPVTFANVNPRDTLDDYRLVRGTVL